MMTSKLVHDGDASFIEVISTSRHQVSESGRRWAIARTPDGFLRHADGQPPAMFQTLDAALDDCGVVRDTNTDKITAWLESDGCDDY